jgi:hypothetical protein
MSRSIEIPTAVEDRRAAQHDPLLQDLIGMSPEEVDQWLDDNVLNIPDIREVLKSLVKAVMVGSYKL